LHWLDAQLGTGARGWPNPMLFLLFRLGKERYALEASRVLEVLPLLNLRRLPQAPKGVAGVFNYRGTPVPAVDLSELTLGHPAKERLSTRIIVVNYVDAGGKHLVGLVAEEATETLRKEAAEFVPSGVNMRAAPYLGPVLMDNKGPVQWLREEGLFSEPIRQVLFSRPALLES